MKRFLLSFGLVVLFHLGYSQETTPAQTLRLARSIYEQGRLHEIVEQLGDKFFNEALKPEKVEGHKLLCLTYIYLEEPQKADDEMLKILQTDPYFKPSAVDPAEFVALYNTFRTMPIYRIGAKLGVDAARPNVIETTTAGELSGESKYTPLIGILFGASADVPVNSRLTIHGDLIYNQKRFRLNQVFDRQENIITGEKLTNETEAIEQQTWLSFPISVQYKPLNESSILDQKINPYIAAGFAVDYLLNAKITAEQIRAQQSSIQEKSYDISRKSINLSAVAAIGSKIKVGGGYIVAEIRYLYGITKVNSKETAYENQEITWEINYADPVFKVSSLQLSAAYVQNIFNPKKLKRKK